MELHRLAGDRRQRLPDKLVVEVRDVKLIEGAKTRQRAIAERLLLSALHDQDAARVALDATQRARFLAEASRDLSMSLDEHSTRDAVRSLSLPRPGTWSIVDIIESNGALHRLAVVHPDPAKQTLARLLEEKWPARAGDAFDDASMSRSEWPTVVTHDSGVALMQAAHGEDNLKILAEIGFGSLLVVPLIVRARVQGTMTFVSAKGDPPFTPDEIALALDLATWCAMALDNARLYREADALRIPPRRRIKPRGNFSGA